MDYRDRHYNADEIEIVIDHDAGTATAYERHHIPDIDTPYFQMIGCTFVHQIASVPLLPERR